MPPARPRGLTITGTNTEVGKTYVAARIVRQLRDAGVDVGVYKPVASGCENNECDDARRLWEAAGKPDSLELVCPQRFRAPVAPHLAARLEGREVDASLLVSGLDVWRDRYSFVVVEGAGGLLSPASPDLYFADLAFDFGYPLIVVAPNELGAINQTLQTLVTASTFRDGLSVGGIVLNDVHPNPEGTDPSRTSNFEELVERCVPPVLAHMKYNGEFTERIDWQAIRSA